MLAKKMLTTGASIVIASTLLTGCMATNASKTGGSDYRTAETRQAGEVQYGILKGVRTVTIRENEGTEARNAGAMGTGGALLGGAIGGNSNGMNGLIVGSLIGAVAGAVASDKLGETPGWEMDVQLPSGKIIVVVQSKKDGETFAAGQNVRVVQYGTTYRVTANN